MADKTTESVICHEWGHALAAYLLWGKECLDTIEFIENGFNVDGHTMLHYTRYDPDRAEEITIVDQTEKRYMVELLAGVAAENICGYSKVFLHKGTDADKTCAFMPNKKEREKIKDEVLELLEPHKASLEWLVKTTLERYPTERDESGCIYYRIFRNELINWIEESLKIK